MTHERQFCTFFVDDLFLGVEVRRVQEVIRHQEMTRVPLASDVIGGLINLRGQIVAAVDLRRRMDLNAAAEGALPMNVVVRAGDGVVSLLVDEIGEFVCVNVEPDDFEQAPETLGGVARELIAGVYKLKDRLLLILDTEKTVALKEAA